MKRCVAPYYSATMGECSPCHVTCSRGLGASPAQHNSRAFCSCGVRAGCGGSRMARPGTHGPARHRSCGRHSCQSALAIRCLRVRAPSTRALAFATAMQAVQHRLGPSAAVLRPQRRAPMSLDGACLLRSGAPQIPLPFRGCCWRRGSSLSQCCMPVPRRTGTGTHRTYFACGVGSQSRCRRRGKTQQRRQPPSPGPPRRQQH